MGGRGAQEWSALGIVASAVLALLVVILTLVSVRHNGRMVVEMGKPRLVQSNPLILLNVDGDEDQNIVLRCRNYGVPMTGMRFVFDPLLVNSQVRNIGDGPLLREDSPLAPPGNEQAMHVDGFWRFFSIDYFLGKRVASFTATVHAGDSASGHLFDPTPIALDLAPLTPIDTIERVYRAPLADRVWSWKSEPGSGNLAVLEDAGAFLLAEGAKAGWFDEQRSTSHELRYAPQRLGWSVATDNWSGRSARLVAIKRKCRHQEGVVKADG